MTDQTHQDTLIENAGFRDTVKKSRSAWKWAIQFVEGSGPDFSKEINSVLAQRLKMASLILFGAHLAFLLKGILLSGSATPIYGPVGHWLHLLALTVSGVIAWRLCADCTHILGHLRAVELILFSASFLYVVVVTHSIIVRSAEEGYLYPVATPWLILIFTYALFIPNSWQRALTIMSPMALAPVLILGIAAAFNPTVRDVLMEPLYRTTLLQTAMGMVLALVIATWGVATIRSLRSAAFEAQQLGRYRLKKLLGKGGMGEVYLAEHTLLKRPCAVKLIRPEMAGDPQTLQRFEREVRATAQLTHWNTVEIFDYGMSEDGTFYYVMEYLPGLTMEEIVEQHGPMPLARVVHILKQACDALSEAHTKGLVHRDIKPANIFAARRGGTYDVVKLLDFGLVRSNELEADLKLTQVGKVAGSPLYMSPEQASGEEADARSDIYCLGCVAYFLLTGQPPFDESNAVKLLMAHVHQSPPSPREVNASVPEEISNIVMRCLEKSPESRFGTVDELRDALELAGRGARWTRQEAKLWWQTHVCPKKQLLDECVMEGRPLPADDEMSEANSEPPHAATVLMEV